MKEIIRERFRVKHPTGMFYRVTNTKGAARESGRVRFPSKICRFSHPFLRAPKARRRDFAVCGQRPGLLALDLASIFEKLLDRKTLLFGAIFHHAYSTSQAAIRLNRTLPLPVPVHLSSRLPAPATPVPCRGTAYASARGSFRSPAPTAVSGARLPFPTLPQRSYT